MGEFILDEGIGTRDNEKRSNIDVANEAIANSTDERIKEGLSMNDSPRKSLKVS